MKTRKSFVVAAVSLLICWGYGLAVASDPNTGPWDLNTDMDTSVNDNGIWAYGYGGHYVPSDPNAVCFAGLMTIHYPDGYVWVADTPGEPDPHIFKHVGDINQTVNLGYHGMNGGSTGDGAAIRWTPPALFVTEPKTVDISGTLIMKGDGPTADYILIKQDADDPNIVEVLFDIVGATPGQIVNVNASTSVSDGDIIVLLVMPGSGATAGNDWVQTSLKIEGPTEPEEPDPNGPWDLNTDMDPSVTNDTGIWAYGYGDGTTFAGLMTNHPDFYVWVADTPGEPDPHIFKNVDGRYDWNGIAIGYHAMNGGSTGDGAAVRWTAPVADGITVTGELKMGGYGPTANYRLVKNNSELLFEKVGALPGQVITISANASVNVGDTIVLFVMPESGATASDDWVQTSLTVTRGIILPTCQEQGKFLPADVDHDCYVNLADFAIIAASWLECNDPQNESCTAVVE